MINNGDNGNANLIIWTAGVVSAAHAVAVVENVPGVPRPLDGLQLGVVLPVPHPPVRLYGQCMVTA